MALGNWRDIPFGATNLPDMQQLGLTVARRMRSMPKLNVPPSSLTQYSPIVGAIMSSRPKVEAPKVPQYPTTGPGVNRTWDFVQKWEGGYSNDKDDPGGETMYGIASAFNPGVDVKKITRDDAMRIFRDKYYNPSGADRMSPGVGLYLADAAFNQGLGGMQDIMRNALNTTDIDAMNAMDQREVLDKIHEARMNRYRSNKNWEKYGKGWSNRANDAYATALQLLGLE